MTHDKQGISRREFLKRSAAFGAAAAAIPGCGRTASSPASGDEAQSGEMTYRMCGDDKVSLLGYGCMRWPTIGTGGDVTVDQDKVNELVDYALQHGVNYFDTSPVYVRGLSERATGIALSRHPRQTWRIATKMSNMGLAGRGYSPERIYKSSVEMYESSFRELGVDRIDYYLLHAIGGGNGMGTLRERFFDCGLLDFLMAERERGRIGKIGWSFHGDIKVFDYMLSLHDEGKYRWDFAQIQMNYVDWRHAQVTSKYNINAEYLYGELNKRGIPCTIMEPLLGGRLSNVPDHVAEYLKSLEPERSVASWAFRFCGTFPGVLSVLSGMTYMEHLKDNLSSLAPLKPLTRQELDYLEHAAELMVSYPTIPCNQCNYCMPCPYGIDIPAVFTHFNKCINEGYMPESRQDPAWRKSRRAFLVGYNRSVPAVRQADHCIGCNQCSPQCPQRIDIPAQMRRVDRYVEGLKRGDL